MSPARLPSLTGMRWLAAFVVFGSHAVIFTGGTSDRLWRAVFDQGRVGVAFFFILSGFIVTWSWRSGDRADSFWRRRFARIYPAYLVALIVGVVVFQTLGQEQRPLPLLADVLLLQSWVPDRGYFFSGNDVGWSLSCEAFFYAILPLLVIAIGRLDVRGRRTIQAGALTGIVLVGIWAVITMPARQYFGEGGPQVFVAYIFPPVRALEFLIGVTIAFDLREGRRLPLPWGVWASLAVGAYALAGALPIGADFAAVTTLPFALLIYSTAQRDLEDRPVVTGKPLLVMLGEWSFCFYLTHRMVLVVVQEFTGTTGGFLSLALIAGCLALSVGVAFALHALVEVPAERRLRGRSRSTPPASVRGPTAPL